MNHCQDIWKTRIPPKKLEIYKQMIDEGLIRNPHVTYYRVTGLTIVEYDSDYTPESIRKEMSRRIKVSTGE